MEGASINKINLIKPLFQEKYSNLFFSLDEKSEISLWDIRTKKRLSSCSLNNKSNENLIYFDSHNDCSQFISGFDSGTIHVALFFSLKYVTLKGMGFANDETSFSSQFEETD